VYAARGVSIFDRVRELLQGGALAHDARDHAADLELRVATVALLLETALQDADYESRERSTILHAIEREFRLSRADATTLLVEAERARRETGDVRSFAARLAERYDAEQRKRIAGLVWQVVYADRVVDDAEVVFATRIAELTGLSAKECQQARESSYAWFSRERHGR
jgi:uncharacterized tellurite resistance protein B-like protein